MKLQEAVDLIRPALAREAGIWADLGAGTGLFSRALANLIGPSGKVLAVDRNPGALAKLRAAARQAPGEWAPIITVEADYHDIQTVAEAAGAPADGVLLANSLHFVADPEAVIAEIAGWLRRDGRLVVVEYDGRPANRWVPYPVSPARLGALVNGAGLRSPRVVNERPSRYGGTMYCAVVERGPALSISQDRR